MARVNASVKLEDGTSSWELSRALRSLRRKLEKQGLWTYDPETRYGKGGRKRKEQKGTKGKERKK